MTPSETIHIPYEVLEIQAHKHLNNKTTYLDIQYSPEILSQGQINACINEEFQPKHILSITHHTGAPTYEVHWQPAWQLESIITVCDSSSAALSQ